MEYPCGDGIFFEKGEWSFENKAVVSVFEEHIEKQIPGYDLTHRIAIDEIDKFENDDLIRILDLGCSKGTFESKLNLELDYRKNMYIEAIDSSQKMIAYAKDFRNVVYKVNDIKEQLKYYYQRGIKFDIIVCLFTLQFLKEPIEVMELMEKVLEHNGVIILADKFSPNGIQIIDAREELEKYKMSNGYTREEINGKKFALQGKQRTVPRFKVMETLGDFFKYIEVTNISKYFSVYVFKGGRV